MNTVLSWFRDIKFSDNLWFSDCVTKTVFSIYYIKSFNLVTLCDLVTVLQRPKVSLNRDCTAVQKHFVPLVGILSYFSLIVKKKSSVLYQSPCKWYLSRCSRCFLRAFIWYLILSPSIRVMEAIIRHVPLKLLLMDGMPTATPTP